MHNTTNGVNLGVAYGAGSGNITGLVYVNSSLIAGSSSDTKVYFWNTNFIPVNSFSTGHTSTVSCIVMATSSIMITASYDFTAKVKTLCLSLSDIKLIKYKGVECVQQFCRCCDLFCSYRKHYRHYSIGHWKSGNFRWQKLENMELVCNRHDLNEYNKHSGLVLGGASINRSHSGW